SVVDTEPPAVEAAGGVWVAAAILRMAAPAGETSGATGGSVGGALVSAGGTSGAGSPPTMSRADVRSDQVTADRRTRPSSSEYTDAVAFTLSPPLGVFTSTYSTLTLTGSPNSKVSPLPSVTGTR